jgi:hypothetical protein
MIACMPEPQSLLMVVAPAVLGMPAAMEACRAGALLHACGQHAAHDHFVDIARGEAAALDGGADGRGAEFHGAHAGENAVQTAHGGACAASDDYR